MNDVQNTPIIVGISGSSGVAIAEKTINRLLQEDVPVITVCSNYAKLVWHQELGKSFKDSLSIWSEHPKFQYFRSGDMTANIASGSTPIRSMIVAPCSMSTLASIANGISSNLLHRAADVTIKENRNLIIVPRETPLSPIHLENMTKLANLGVKIIPPMPAFYLKPNSVDEIIDYFVEKILIVSGGVSNYDSKFIYSPEEILPDIYDEK